MKLGAFDKAKQAKFNFQPYLEVCEILAEDEELVLVGGLVELGLVDALVGFVGVSVLGVLVERGPEVVAHHDPAVDVDRQVALPRHPALAVSGRQFNRKF